MQEKGRGYVPYHIEPHNMPPLAPHLNCQLTEFIFLTKITATHNDDALSYHREREPYFLAVIFAAIILYKLTYKRQVYYSLLYYSYKYLSTVYDN